MPKPDGTTRASSAVVETFRPELVSLARIRSFLRSQGAASRLDPACTEDLVLAACEAASNAILHANGTSIRVTWGERSDGICIQVRDDGVFLRRVRRPDDIGGRGVPLMVALMDEVGIREGTPTDPGTEVRLIKRCAPVGERSEGPDRR